MIKLYEFPPTRSIRPRWMLQELGIEFESVTVNLAQGDHQTAEFLKINPAAKLPALVDGDYVLTESAAIVLYLAERSQNKFMPKDLKQRGDVYRWLFFTVTELEQPLWRIARNTSDLYPEHERQPLDVKIAKREFKQMVAVLEEHMQGRKYVVSDDVTVCDFVLAYTLDWGNEVGLLDACPQLRAYLERMYQRPQAALRIAAALAAVSGAA
jgi:glutathione S-transferase